MPEPRVCQFFLRGRCQRGEKCDFSHVMPSNSSTATTTANGSKDQQQSGNTTTSVKASSMSASSRFYQVLIETNIQ